MRRFLVRHQDTLTDVVAASIAWGVASARAPELALLPLWTKALPLALLLFLGPKPDARAALPRSSAWWPRWASRVVIVGLVAVIWRFGFNAGWIAGVVFGGAFLLIRALIAVISWRLREKALSVRHPPAWWVGLVHFSQRLLDSRDGGPAMTTIGETRVTRGLFWLMILGGAALNFKVAAVPGAPWFNREPVGHYALQTAGFLVGQLHAAVEPHPELLALPNPYDPVANAPYRIHDMTLWQGRYYLYFGVAPILLLILPVRVLTGFYLGEPAVAAIFTSLGLLGAALVLREWRRRCFPGVSPRYVLLLLGVLAVGNPALLLNQNAQFYQIPIACAYALAMGGIWAVFRALTATHGTYRWLLLAGSAFGLCLAARPNYLLATAALVFPVLHLWRIRAAGTTWPCLIRLAAAVYVPIGLIGVGLLAYNHLRFGNPLEFGMRYQLAGHSQVDFTPLQLGNLLPTAAHYLWAKAWWLPYFPFFEPLPEAVIGVLRYYPLVWLALISALLAIPSPAGRPPAVERTLVRCIAALGIANLVMLSLYAYVPLLRYLADFVPAFFLLGAMGAIIVLQHQAGSRWLRSAIGVIALATTGPTLATYLQRSPTDHSSSALARAFNTPAHWLQRLAGREHGHVRLLIDVPPTPQHEPLLLLRTGLARDRFDELRLHVGTVNQVEVGFLHAGLGELRTGPLSVPPSRVLDLEIHASVFLPPPAHPIYRGWSPDEVAAAHRRLEIRVGGQIVLSAALTCYPGAPRQWLQSPPRPVLELQQLPLEREPIVPAQISGIDRPQRLRIQFPAVPADPEPLLATGEGMESNLLFLRYGPGHTVRFGLDHYGGNSSLSAPLPYDPLRIYDVDIWLGSWARLGDPANASSSLEASRLMVRINGRDVLVGEQEFYPDPRRSTVVGKNPSRMGSAGPRFTGRIHSIGVVPE